MKTHLHCMKNSLTLHEKYTCTNILFRILVCNLLTLSFSAWPETACSLPCVPECTCTDSASPPSGKTRLRSSERPYPQSTTDGLRSETCQSAQGKWRACCPAVLSQSNFYPKLKWDPIELESGPHNMRNKGTVHLSIELPIEGSNHG